MDLLAAALARPRVRVNQVGYRLDGPKAATVVTDAPAALPFAVRAAGRTVLTGRTVPAGTDSGLPVHRLDLTGLRQSGTYVVELAGLASHPFTVAADPYAGLLGDALRFFTLQRSGTAITEPGYERPAGHAGVPPNQGDTAVPYGGRTHDVSGGWYDAGDHGKYLTSGAPAASMLLAAAERHGAPTVAEARWQVEWLLRMQVPPGQPHAGLAFHRVHDRYWTPLPLWPHLDPAPRVLHPPSTAAGLHLAAAAAHAARLVPGAGYLEAARTAYAAARAEPDLLAPDDAGAHGGGPYADADLDDDFYWAATELWLTTREQPYLDALLASPGHAAELGGGFDWDDLTAYARIELALHAGLGRAAVAAAADRLLALRARQPWGQPYGPADGWDWGSTGRILSAVLVLAAAHQLTGAARYRAGALGGLDYVFGRNPVGLSYVTGWGTDTAHRQRVRHFGHALDPSFPPPPRGSVAGGPASKDYPGFPADPRFAGLPDQLHYVDEPTSETTNDVCIRWNAPLVLVAAYLTDAGAAAGG